MSDIALRLHKDMLVLSAPLNASLRHLGFETNNSLEYITLFETDSLHDALRLEMVAGATCLVTSTSHITPAQLARLNMDGHAQELAEAALDVVRALNPQHVLVEVGPCGLPLDAASKASLNENRDQYARAVRTFNGYAFDAFFLNGFTSCSDLKCALMGLRQASDLPVFASVDVDGEGGIGSCRGTLEEAVAIMSDCGATVAGLSTNADSSTAVKLAHRMAKSCDLPLLVQLVVAQHNPKQGVSTSQNPYYCPDVMVEVATALRATGVQFLRATGEATPAYTGALAAAIAGFDVSLVSVNEPLSPKADVSMDNLIASARAELAAAIGKEE